MARTPALIALLATCLALSACTPSSPGTPLPTSPGTVPSIATPSPTTSSATPSPTWSTEQAAAIQAVDGYRAASDQIGADPASFTEAQMRSMLGKWAGSEVVKSNVASFLSLKKRGYRYDIQTNVLSTKASRASDVGYGIEVVITRCIDQRPAKVFDKNGGEVSDAELGYRVPEFLLRQYTAQRRTGDNTFLVYGLAPTRGECGPS